ncbi:hypothetical protein DFQ05_1861 [Winogradskyella wandonensis]|uniref:Uncharacterized protein n=2 Tax=Winogradskyella wandonensis TaxID=1442586 RepID=A0A4R1KSP4_9FLAO|nr:hypothetical protein DFQ05_1861 [Winogradskyella wandonensis]
MFLGCLLSLSLSCSTKTFDTEKELLDYITDEANGYVQKKSVNGYDFSLLYRPTDLLVHQELSDDEKSDSKRIKELRDKYNKHLYFNLSMSKNNQELLSTAPKDRNEFGAMVNQLAFGMNKKVHLFTQSKDTIELADFIYPRMYGMSKSTTIMFVYPRDENLLEEDYLNFTIEDLGLYTGEIRLKVPTKTIKKEPTLIY